MRSVAFWVAAVAFRWSLSSLLWVYLKSILYMPQTNDWNFKNPFEINVQGYKSNENMVIRYWRQASETNWSEKVNGESCIPRIGLGEYFCKGSLEGSVQTKTLSLTKLNILWNSEFMSHTHPWVFGSAWRDPCIPTALGRESWWIFCWRKLYRPRSVLCIEGPPKIWRRSVTSAQRIWQRSSTCLFQDDVQSRTAPWISSRKARHTYYRGCRTSAKNNDK